jgi:hypothetical protein
MIQPSDIKLDVITYINKVQYLWDEGFTITPFDDIETFTLGVLVEETGERFYFANEDLKKMLINDLKIDVNKYHGRAKILAEGINIILDNFEKPIEKGKIETKTTETTTLLKAVKKRNKKAK